MASITKYKLKSGATRYRVSVHAGTDAKTGRKKNIVRSAKNKQEAELMAARLQVAVSNGTIDEKAHRHNPTFAEVQTEWWGNYVNTVRPSTAFKTKRLFDNHILKKFGKFLIAKITTRDIQQVVKQWADESKVAYKQRFIYTKTVLKYAVKAGYLEKNPADNVTLPRAPEEIGKSPEYWDKQQLERFFSCIDPNVQLETYVSMRILAYTGIRREELTALTFGDIDFEAGTLSVNKAVVQGEDGKESIQPPKSAAGYRTIPLDPETLSWLKRWRTEFHRVSTIINIGSVSGDSPLFQRKDGRRRSLNTPGQRLRRIIKNNHLTPYISLHGLRKSFVTNALQAGVPVPTVQRLAGHADPSVTLAVYSGMNQEAARKGTDTLAKYLAD